MNLAIKGHIPTTMTCSYRNALMLLDSSLSRRITALFWTITNNMWVSLGALIGATLGFRIKPIVELKENPHMKNDAIYRAVKSLNSQTKLNSPTVHQYCTYLAEKHRAQYISNWCTEGQSTRLTDFPSATHSKIIIPVVLKD